MNSVILSSPPLLALLGAALLCAAVAGQGRRFAFPAWLGCMVFTLALVLGALVCEAELIEPVTALLLLTAVSLLCSAFGKGENL